MLDDFREKPRETLAGILDRRRKLDPRFRPPALVGLLSWLFLDARRRGIFGKLMLSALRLKPIGASPRQKHATTAAPSA
jgi:hypothetical protein